MIYIVEDDASIRELEQYALQTNGYPATGFADGASFWVGIREKVPDLVILDVMLPDEDGYQILGKLRENAATRTVPVIMVTAKTSEIDVVKGLDHGADDYLCKPFGIMEFISRVKAVLRRFTPEPAPTVSLPASAPAKIAEYPDLVINLTNYSVTYRGTTLDMPPKEIELLYFLASQPNQVFTREQLLDHIWGYEYAGDTRTVDVHIKRIREKISDNENWSIATVWGVGYKFEVKTL